ncbi:MAG: ATP/GTP-binding protein [Thermococcus sp.]|nr:ATP/GTP-binding protein [Thermococcus sp.]
MICNLKIENFRGIKSLELKNLGQINVIAGKNNSSKSSVLEALALFLGAMNGPQPFREIFQEILVWRGWYGEQTIIDIFHENSEKLMVIGELNDGKNLQLSILKKMGQIDDAISIGFGSVSKPDPNVKSFNTGVSKKSFVDSRIIQRMLLNAKFSPKLNFEFLTPLTLRKFGYVESLYSYAYERKVSKKAVNVLKSAYPEVDGFSPLIKEDRWVLHVETQYGVHPYYLMGEGFKNAMIIAFLSALLKDGYLLIDSAEAFHHPKSLKIMAQTLIRGATENNVQVFLTTHSLELIDMLLEYGLKEGIDGRIIHMKRENEKLSAKMESFKSAKDLREALGLDLRG